MAIPSIQMVILFVKWKSFSFLNLLVNCLNFLLVNLSRIRNGSTGYDSSATVYKVLFRYKPDASMFPSMDNFTLIFQSCGHPDIVLQDNVSLYSIDANEATFVDCTTADVFDSSHHTFVYQAQFDLAQTFIRLPITSFHNVTSQIKLPSIPMVHLANHGRCGSTLLTKMFEAIPGTLSISETFPFSNLAFLSIQGVIGREELKKLFFSTLMCTIKHCNSRNSKILFLKLQHLVTYVTDVMMEVLPDMKHIFMYRQPVPFVRSWEKLFCANNWSFFNDKMWLLVCGFGHNELLKDCPHLDEQDIRRLSPFAKLALLWITCAAAFKELVSSGYPISSLKYEDLLTKPKEILISIFKHLKIDETFLPDIDKVMSQDSQAGSEFTSRDVDKKKLEASFTPIVQTLTDEVDELCEDFDTPLFWGDVRLDKSIASND